MRCFQHMRFHHKRYTGWILFVFTTTLLYILYKNEYSYPGDSHDRTYKQEVIHLKHMVDQTMKPSIKPVVSMKTTTREVKVQVSDIQFQPATTASSNIMKQQQERQQRIADFCSAHKATVAKNASGKWNYKVNKKLKYMMCPIPKCGWSSWKRLWFYTAGLISNYTHDVGIRDDRDAGVLGITRSQLAGVYQRRMYNFSFTFVRNPWDRLVSAYINKAVDYNYTRILHTPCAWERMVPYKDDLSFEQFLTCISQGQRDMHWIPQWRLCDVCGIKYDFIGHFDTINEDSQYVIHKIGLNLTYPHAFSSKAYKGRSLEDWYRDLPASLLEKLMKIYRYDFELHGFNKTPPGRTDL